MTILNPKSVTNFLINEKTEKDGYLLKKRTENKHTYKRRYFVLCGNILAYFEKKSDKDPLGVIFLECYTVDMIDDMKIAIRFRVPGDLCRSYILKSENSKDAEDWMRVLSRANIDYLNLALEDFEDYYRALTTVANLSKNVLTSLKSNSNDHAPKGRSNPFNKNTLLQGSSKSNNKQLASLNKVNQLPPNDYVHWLLSQNWEQLNSYLMIDFNIHDNRNG